MTRQETAKVLASIVEVYPAFLNGRNLENTVNIWQTLFADEPYKAVEAGVLAYMSTDTKGFAPSPGQIKERIAMVTTGDDPDEAEAWAMVSKALRNSYYGYRQEFARLPEAVQMAVGSPEMLREWSMMDEDTVHSVIASNFQRGYRGRAATRREVNKLPAAVREMLGSAVSGMLLGENPSTAAAVPLPLGREGSETDGCITMMGENT